MSGVLWLLAGGLAAWILLALIVALVLGRLFRFSARLESSLLNRR